MTEAVKWYACAAEQGVAEAQFRLGECYDDADGVEHDEKKAFQLYMDAAQQGHRKAQCYVGYCYQYGLGVAEDQE